MKAKILFLIALAIGMIVSTYSNARANGCTLEPKLYGEQGWYCAYEPSEGEIDFRPVGDYCHHFDLAYYVQFWIENNCDNGFTGVSKGSYTVAVLSEDGSEPLRSMPKTVRAKVRAGSVRLVGIYLPTTLVTSSDGSVRTVPIRIRTLSNDGNVGELTLGMQTQTVILPPPPPPPPPTTTTTLPNPEDL
jgi:hypothetical protein